MLDGQINMRDAVDGDPIAGGIFDFGLFLFHNAKRLIDKGSGPYFYLPKLESHLEARLWNDILIYAQGGMAAQIPIKHDPEANAEAFAKVRAHRRELGEAADQRHR